MRTDLTDVRCSIAQTMHVIGDAWTMLILRDVFAGLTRFDQLQQDLEVSRKTLAQRLNALMDTGILAREPYSEHPPRYDYLPTEKGADLFPVIAAMMRWGDRWTAAPPGPPAEIRHRCGSTAIPELVCGRCGEPITLANSSTEAGPGGRAGHRTRLLGRSLTTHHRS